jgi:hypothetical protein
MILTVVFMGVLSTATQEGFAVLIPNWRLHRLERLTARLAGILDARQVCVLTTHGG